MELSPEILDLLKLIQSGGAGVPPISMEREEPALDQPYNERATRFDTQAGEFETPQQYQRPQGVKENIIAGLQSGMQDFGRWAIPGGSTGAEVRRQGQFNTEQAARAARAKELRGLSQQEREAGATAVQRGTQNKLQQGQLDETAKLRGIQERQQSLAEAEARKPKVGNYQPGTQVGATNEQGVTSFTEVPGQREFAPRDPKTIETAEGVLQYDETTDSWKRVGGLKPQQNSAATGFGLNNPPAPPEVVAWIAEQVKINPLNMSSLTSGNETLRNQVNQALAGGGANLAPRSADERKDAGNLSVMIDDTFTLQNLATSNKDAIGPLQGRWQAIKRATIGTGNAEVNELFRISDNLADQLLRARSGAQINEGEYARLRTLVPNPRGPEDKFFSDLAGFVSELKRTQLARFPGQAQQPAGGGQAPPRPGAAPGGNAQPQAGPKRIRIN